MKKYCALRFNSSTLQTRVLGFGTYEECVLHINNDSYSETPNFHFFILETVNKVSQGYIQKDLSNIIGNVAWCLKTMDRCACTNTSKYLYLKDMIYNYLLSDVDLLISHSTI